MKKIYILTVFLILLLGCENILNIQPTDIISSDDVNKDPALIEAFLNKVYANTRFQSVGVNLNDAALLGVMSDEMNVFAAWQINFAAAIRIINENGAHDQAEYWPYDNIRSSNEIIKILDEGKFDQDFLKQKKAEARWLRAFMYFELVKRYGGVPIITEPQSIELPNDELFVKRNSEKEVYDFIASEMDELVNILPDSYSSDHYGKPTKWAAHALKSRAMLYAGSIAKYGSVQLDGLLGIPYEDASNYYQKAYDAAIQVIDNSSHELYKSNTDPVANYNEIFIKDGNSEIIFAVVYDLGLLKTHSWGYLSMPDGFQTGWGSNHWMYLETLEKYEYNDGTSGKLDHNLLDGITKFSLDDIILNRDPRFLASAFYPEMPWQEGKVYMHSKTIGAIPDGSDWPSVAKQRNRIKTGLMVRKRVNEDIKLPIGYENDEDWIVFRTGEMYLNAAEAAFEINNMDEAKRLLNIIRERAGMPEKTNLTVEDIRNERFVELYIEEHRYWDIRRWRIAEEILNGKGFNGVDWEYHIEEDKYTLKIKNGDFNNIRTFAERNYYFPIGLKRISENPNLIENPNYK